MKRSISIILPIYNEEKNIPIIYKELNSSLEAVKDLYDFEFIFVNDGSRDNSWMMIQQLSNQDPRVRGISFSRNFGHQMALTAGYDAARGDAVITMDSDMQDPPDIVPKMLELWKQGSSIVYARRIDRKDSFLKQITAKFYYKFLEVISDVKIPRNVGDFRLIDRKVLDTMNRCREKARYFRGMVAWTGFSHTFIDFVRPNRTNGTTGYTWKKMFKLAFDGMTGFSVFPLKIAAYAGLFVILTGTMMFAYISIDAIIYRVNYPLFKWLVTIIYIFMGVQFILLWFLGEYIGRIYDQQKERPLYIISEKTRISESDFSEEFLQSNTRE